MILTKQQKQTINAIIAAKIRISLDQEAVTDDTAALAISLSMRPREVNRLVSIVMKEQGKGGVIEQEGRLLELAEQVVVGDGEGVGQ